MAKKKTGGKPARPATEKALLKVYVNSDVLQRARMTAANRGVGLGELTSELLAAALPTWKAK